MITWKRRHAQLLDKNKKNNYQFGQKQATGIVFYLILLLEQKLKKKKKKRKKQEQIHGSNNTVRAKIEQTLINTNTQVITTSEN